MKRCTTGTFCLITLAVFGFLSACGNEEETNDKRAIFSAPAEKQVMELTEEEWQNTIDELAAETERQMDDQLTADLICSMASAPAAIFSVEGCEAAYQECMNSADSEGLDQFMWESELPELPAVPEECTATVGELEQCFVDALAQARQAVETLNDLSCTNLAPLESEHFNAVDEEGSVPSCEVVAKKCPKADGQEPVINWT